jgi:hypothetical protein
LSALLQHENSNYIALNCPKIAAWFVVIEDRLHMASSPLAQPPDRRRVTGRKLGCPQCHEVASLVGVAANLGAILAAHITLKLVDLRPALDVQGNGLVRDAAGAFDFEIRIAGVERVAEAGDGPVPDTRACADSKLGMPDGRLSSAPP